MSIETILKKHIETIFEKHNVTTSDLVTAINDILKEGFVLTEMSNIPASRTEPFYVINTFFFTKGEIAKHIWYEERLMTIHNSGFIKVELLT